jgi:hypothetical protein
MISKNLNGRHLIKIDRTITEHGYGEFTNGELQGYEPSEEIDEVERHIDTIVIIE